MINLIFKHITCLECKYKGTIECPNTHSENEKLIGLNIDIDPFTFYCAKAKSENKNTNLEFVYNDFYRMAEEQGLNWDKIFNKDLDRLNASSYFFLLNMFEYSLNHSQINLNKEPQIAMRLLNIQNKIKNILSK